MNKTPLISADLERYVNEVISRETQLQKRLRQETSRLPEAVMQTTPDQVAFLALLVRLLNAKNILEIGTFTGYSALAMAAALPDDGRLIACDMSEEWTNIARRYWQEAGLAGRIELHLGPAQKTLEKLFKDQKGETFDLAFIDADKTGYDLYYETCLRLIRQGGVIVFDNMLWGGAVIDPSDQDPDTKALRELNLKLRDDQRVDVSLLTVADGIMLARKK